jgi:hypothetical protein
MHIVWILRIDNIEGFTIKTLNLKSTSYKIPNHQTVPWEISIKHAPFCIVQTFRNIFFDHRKM